MGLLKKYRRRSNVNACAIKFMKTVGADLYIRPKVEFLHKESRRLSQWVKRRYVLQNFNLIACRTLQNTISASRH